MATVCHLVIAHFEYVVILTKAIPFSLPLCFTGAQAALLKSCSEQKVTKKVKCGILQCVHVLEVWLVLV